MRWYFGESNMPSEKMEHHPNQINDLCLIAIFNENDDEMRLDPFHLM